MTTLFRILIEAILRAFFPSLFEYLTRDGAEEALPQPALKARLRDRIRAVWGGDDPPSGAAPALALAFTCALALSGCGTRTVYVPDGEPVRLREPVKAKVWVMGPDGVARPGDMTIPEGWYALPDKRTDDTP